VDIKIGLRSNLVANLTGNTDFADSDVDVSAIQSHPLQIVLSREKAVLSGKRRCLCLSK